MSEPKTVATTMQEIIPGLVHYSIQDERVRSQSDAYAVVADGRAVLVDPLPLETGLFDRLGRIEAIVLGAPSHQRCAWSLRRRHGVKVWAPEGAQKLDESPDVFYKEGDRLPGGLRPLHAPGPNPAHHALLVDRAPGVLLCTDLWHQVGDRIEFLPDKYMNDRTRARDTARRLLAQPFDILCLGHGDPVRANARRVLEEVVAKDAAARGGA